MIKTSTKYIIFLLCGMPLLSLRAQNDSLSPKKYYVGVFFSPEYNYRIVNSSAAYQFIVDYRNNYDIAHFGLTAGVKYGRRFKKRFAFETGILFTEKCVATKKFTDFV